MPFLSSDLRDFWMSRWHLTSTRFLEHYVLMPLQRAWTPLFYSMRDESEAAGALARVATYLFGAGVAFSLVISLAVPPLLRLTARVEYHGAAR